MADSSSSSSSEEAENRGPGACVAMDCNAKPKPKISQVVSARPLAPLHVTHSSSHSTGYTIEAAGIYYYTRSITTKSVHWCSWGRRRRTAGRRAVLRNIGCRACPGQILAVAGPSGAGKSTLLGLLAGRLRPGAGAVAIDGRAATTAQLRHISALVAQEEALFPLLTVEETLTFSARLRLRGLPRAEMAARVGALLDELGLRHVAWRRVGNGISGGERRRVAIGMDVVHDPRVLLLDEPTSGLDSAAAVQVASMLKRMASGPHGRTLVVSIHQPGCRILHMFDSLLLLCGGCVVHHGSLGLLSARLAAAGRIPRKHVNVLEFAMENLDSLSSSSSPKVKHKEPPAAVALPLNVTMLDEETAMGDNTGAKRMTTTYANGPWRETLILTERAWKNTVRSKRLFLGRTLQALLVGLLLGTLFLHIGTRAGDAALQDRAGFFAFTLTFLLSSTTEGLPMFLAERRILRRETAQGAYRVASHVAAGAVAAVPVLALAVLAFALPAYWLVGLAPAPAAFAVFVGVAWLAMAAASSLVACLAALAPDFILGNSLISGVMGAFFLFSGYFIAKEDIPTYWLFAHYLSLFKYPFEAFVVNEFVRLPTPEQSCWGREQEQNPLLGSCPLDAQAFLRSRGLRRHDVWRNALVLAIFGVAYRVLCFVVLYCKYSSPSPSSSLSLRRRRRRLFGFLP